MVFRPAGEADVAELVGAPADHVVAALVLLDEHAALGAPLPLLELGLEVLVARALMGLHHALLAVLGAALAALRRMPEQVHNSLPALFPGAELDVGVVQGLLPQPVLVVLGLDLLRQRCIKL